MTSLLILAEDDSNPTSSQQAMHDVVLSISDNGDCYVLKDRQGESVKVLEATHPSRWRDFIRTLSLR